MPTMDQMEMKVSNLKKKRNLVQEKIDKLQEQMDKYKEEKDKYQKQIDSIVGVQEDADGAITTTTAGNISVPGGSGNYSPKIGMMMRRRKKKKTNESAAFDYMDKLFG